MQHTAYVMELGNARGICPSSVLENPTKSITMTSECRVQPKSNNHIRKMVRNDVEVAAPWSSPAWWPAAMSNLQASYPPTEPAVTSSRSAKINASATDSGTAK